MQKLNLVQLYRIINQSQYPYKRIKLANVNPQKKIDFLRFLYLYFHMWPLSAHQVCSCYFPLQFVVNLWCIRISNVSTLESPQFGLLLNGSEAQLGRFVPPKCAVGLFSLTTPLLFIGHIGKYMRYTWLGRIPKWFRIASKTLSTKAWKKLNFIDFCEISPCQKFAGKQAKRGPQRKNRSCYTIWRRVQRSESLYEAILSGFQCSYE